jgi:hypothetical protein
MNDLIYYNKYNVSTDTWDLWFSIPGSTIDGPGAVILDGKLYLAVRGSDEVSLWFSYVDIVTDSFSGWITVDGSTPSSPTLN